MKEGFKIIISILILFILLAFFSEINITGYQWYPRGPSAPRCYGCGSCYSGPSGSPYCSGNTIMQKYQRSYCSCNTCKYSYYNQVKQTCPPNYKCTGGSCVYSPPVSSPSQPPSYPSPKPSYPTCSPNCAASSGWIGTPSCSGNNIMQNYRTYSCSGGYCTQYSIVPKIKQTCSSGYICQNGACVSQTCSDGTAYGVCSTTKPKKCVDSTLVDDCNTCSCPSGYTCTNSQCVTECVPNCAGKNCGDNGCGGTCGACASGETCENGVCKAQVQQPVQQCTDTDEGKNYNIIGGCIDASSSLTDTCIDKVSLTEYYCADNKCVSETITCTTICVDGACVA